MSLSLLPVSDIVSKLEKALETARKHQVEYEWKNLMKTRDLTMLDPNKHRVICTDFASTLDLRGKATDNCSVDNHAVVAIFCVVTGWRKVKYNAIDKNDKNPYQDETIICDCDKWAFFGSTMSKGKKNDHVYHEACLTYINDYYDKIRADKGKDPINTFIVWTDQCPTQYRCRQNFRNIAESSKKRQKNLPNTPSVRIHKFGAKFRFKGPWDAFGKLIKQAILRLELRATSLRCADALMCYNNIGLEMKEELSEEMKKLLECEKSGDARVLGNTTFKSRFTHFGFVTEDIDEYKMLVGENKKHIVFTNREDMPDVKPVPETLKIGQVESTIDASDDNKWKFRTSFLSCSCGRCQLEGSSKNCTFQAIRNVKEQEVNETTDGNQSNPADDPHDLRSLTVAELRTELLERGVVAGRRSTKTELMSRLGALIDSECQE